MSSYIHAFWLLRTKPPWTSSTGAQRLDPAGAGGLPSPIPPQLPQPLPFGDAIGRMKVEQNSTGKGVAVSRRRNVKILYTFGKICGQLDKAYYTV